MEAGDETIELTAICRWSIETSYGFVNGCSLKSGEGRKLAKREFRGTVMPWDINRTRSQAGRFKLNSDQDAAGAQPAAEAEERPLISRSTILLLSAALIALSVRTPESLTRLFFLAGCIGAVTYIGLEWTGRVREAVREKRKTRAKQVSAESRLEAHVQTGASLVRPKSTDQDTNA